jgi:DNA-binding response OmpR family regulator
MTDAPPGARIAVVDDDPRILESLEALLESAGYTVGLFGSATALLEAAELGQIDCVISDINMPVIDGLELSRLLSAARPGLPIILITGHPEMLNRSHTFQLMSHLRLFTKPYNPEELLGTIDHILRSGRNP